MMQSEKEKLIKDQTNEGSGKDQTNSSERIDITEGQEVSEE